MTDLTELSLAEARDGLRARKFSSVELTGASLAAMVAGSPAALMAVPRGAA